VPPELAALEQRLAMPTEAVALGVPAGCHTPLTRDLADRVLGAYVPPVTLVSGLPTLGTLANLHYLATVRLGFPLPHSAVLLAQLMERLDLSALSSIAQMPWGPLSRLAMLVRLGQLLKQRLGIDPGQANASQVIAASLPQQVPAFGQSLPSACPPSVTARLGYLLQLRQLLSLSETLGVQLGGPGGVQQLAMQLRGLLSVRLPVLAVMPSLLPNLCLLAQINAAWPLAGIAANAQPFRAHIAALLKLSVPTPPSCLGPAITPDPSKMTPPMPTPETIEQVLNTDLTELAKADWKIPESVPIMPAIPGLNALAQLQELGPVLVPR
jgi:hypothetical protein